MKQYKNTVNISTHITKTPTQFSKHPHNTKPTISWKSVEKLADLIKNGQKRRPLYTKTKVHLVVAGDVNSP